MCRRPSTTTTNNNTSVVQQLGGDNQFNFLIMTFCENIQEDSSLNDVFNGMDLETLTNLMCSLVHTALERNSFDEDARNRLVLKNYSLFELGMNSKHFERLQAHLESALRDSWVEDALMEKCIQRFVVLLPIFQEEGLELEKTLIAHRVVATRILAASG